MQKDMPYNNQTKAGVPILISDRAYIRGQKVIRDKEGYHTIIKEPVHQNNNNP